MLVWVLPENGRPSAWSPRLGGERPHRYPTAERLIAQATSKPATGNGPELLRSHKLRVGWRRRRGNGQILRHFRLLFSFRHDVARRTLARTTTPSVEAQASGTRRRRRLRVDSLLARHWRQWRVSMANRPVQPSSRHFRLVAVYHREPRPCAPWTVPADLGSLPPSRPCVPHQCNLEPLPSHRAATPPPPVPPPPRSQPRPQSTPPTSPVDHPWATVAPLSSVAEPTSEADQLLPWTST